MSDFSSVLSAAQQLPEKDRLRLIDALWESVPPDSDAPFSDEWAREIERRVAALDAGTAWVC
jgi:putative addiction module component (TIGR02574 family)